jgi:hypothetical protein
LCYATIIDWLFSNCQALVKFEFKNFPHRGVVFIRQETKIKSTNLRKLEVWDNTNERFFSQLVARSRATLEELILETFSPDYFID